MKIRKLLLILMLCSCSSFNANKEGAGFCNLKPPICSNLAPTNADIEWFANTFDLFPIISPRSSKYYDQLINCSKHVFDNKMLNMLESKCSYVVAHVLLTKRYGDCFGSHYGFWNGLDIDDISPDGYLLIDASERDKLKHQWDQFLSTKKINDMQSYPMKLILVDNQ